MNEMYKILYYQCGCGKKHRIIIECKSIVDEVSKEKPEIIGGKCSICGMDAYEEDNGWKTDEECPHFPNGGE